MTSEIDKLKHFHVENYSGTNFTDDLNDGEEFLYTTIRIKDDKEVTFLCKYVKNKHIEVLAKVIKKSNICKHAIKELKLAGYGNGEGGPNDWMYQQVIEAIAVFASHGNSGGSAPWEINLVQKLCDWDIISPLRFTDDEWSQISSDGICLLQQHDINKGWMPKPTQIIDCVEVEISPDNWIMAVDINNIDLIKLDIIYNIQWEKCSCLKGIRLEDVTEELEDKAYEEMRHN